MNLKSFRRQALLALSLSFSLQLVPARISAADATLAKPGSDAASTTDSVLARAEQWTRAKPENADGWVSLGNAWMQKSRDGLTAAAYDRAEAAYRKALELDATQVPAMLGLAWVANSRHDFDAGLNWARKVIDLDPRQPDAYALMGDTAVERGDYQAAFEHYQECLDIRPDLSSYSRSAHLLFLTGDVQRAQALMRRAIAAGGPYPENVAWCRARLARMLFDSGALVLAEKSVEQALKSAPENPHVLATSGKLKIARGQYAEAIRDLDRATRVAPQHGALVDLAEAYRLSGEPAKAVATADRIRSLHDGSLTHAHDPGDVSGHAHAPGSGNAEWARYLADRSQNLDVALREAEAAYRNYKNVYVTDTLAWCYHKNGRNDEALKMVRKALKWKTPDAGILFHAGMIHASAGDLPAARKYLYQALSLNPHFDAADARTAEETLRELAGKGAPGVLRQAAAETTP